jgi:hypothetical protein
MLLCYRLRLIPRRRQGGKRKSTAGAVTPSAQAPALKKHKRG